jgi:hypothetical protein
MEQFIATILALLLSLPAYYTDQETLEERTDRLTTIAEANADVSARFTCSGKYDTKDCTPRWRGSRESLAIALVTAGFWESRFAKHIHEGKCRPGYQKEPGVWARGECDEVIIRNPKTGKITRRYFAARTIFQMQYDRGIRRHWNVMDGTDATSTWYATHAAAIKLSRCYSPAPKKLFMCYAGTRNPAWKGAKPRALFYEAKMRKVFTTDARVASNP